MVTHTVLRMECKKMLADLRNERGQSLAMIMHLWSCGRRNICWHVRHMESSWPKIRAARGQDLSMDLLAGALWVFERTCKKPRIPRGSPCRGLVASSEAQSYFRRLVACILGHCRQSEVTVILEVLACRPSQYSIHPTPLSIE